jgi:type I restriction enzyme R subunit
MKPDEEAFEHEIADWLTSEGGYRVAAQPTFFDPAIGLDTGELEAFLANTQADEWNRLVMLHGGTSDAAQKAFVQRLAAEIDRRGTVDVLRRGVIDHGVHFNLAYFRPAHGLTQSLIERYNRNRLTVRRQVRYETGSTKTVDVMLLVNGLPVATAEIKNRLTGQGVDDAKRQYRTDRDPRNLTLSRRAIVHFAVDTDQVAMTTRLDGAKTQFLPFNRGNNGGAGNPKPDDPTTHRSAYLWRDVWAKDPWLDLLQRFIQVEKAEKSVAGGKKRTIFPRYHQWEAVRLLEAAARSDRAGHDYLAEHSAGSGKSKTIGWLAHRLSSLHDAADNAVFDKVIVLTDRKVLDKQLQDTIFQIDHVHGVVVKIDKDSKQLAAALAGQEARIIITTLQKFPVVEEQGARHTRRRYAVIVDEAHEGQSGESVTDLNAVLGSAADEVPDDAFNAVLEKRARARGKQPNLSFFAFTATPKGETLTKFGRRNPVTGEHEPHHLYSMQQAIEEGFILDVLASYTTYQTYWKIQKAIEDDPRYDEKQAKAAIARFVSLHEVNLAQKSEIIIEHFRRYVRPKINGKAKAMVVTPSRLHAVRYHQALTAYCREHGYDVRILVAFSGEVREGDGPDAPKWTESKLNGFPDSKTKDRFAEDGNHILVVADKYQTGFDQPLLYAMYVDKTLEGLAAVQTLSRLNRTNDGKDGTFVLDFRNDAEAIQKSFAPWYSVTIAPPTDPNAMYDARAALDPYPVIRTDEAERTVAALLAPTGSASHGRVHAALTPAIDRFHALDAADQDAFRDALLKFLRAYAFLAQVVQFTDESLERDYLFGKALAAFIRPEGDAGLDLGSEVELTAIRHEKTSEGSISLDPETRGVVSTAFGGASATLAADLAPLSLIVSTLNDRFGTEFEESDFIRFFGQVAEKLAAQENIQAAAAVNTPENFRLVLAKAFEEQVAAQMGSATNLALKFMDEPGMQDEVISAFLPLIQGRAIAARQEYCPVGELLGPDAESTHLEYKASLRTLADGTVARGRETKVLRTIAAFANSRDGGTLLIGVDDAGSPCGLAGDYDSMHKPGKSDRDLFQLHLMNIVSQSMGAAMAANVSSVQFHTVDGHDICRVHVRPSAVPVDAEVTTEKDGQRVKKTAFYIRTGNSTRELNPTEKAKYLLSRWPAASHL